MGLQGALPLIATIAVLVAWRVSTLRAMLAGAVLGVVRGRLAPLLGLRAVIQTALLAKG